MSKHVAIAQDDSVRIEQEKMADEDALTKSGTRGTSVDGSNYPDSATGMTHKAELKKAERKLLIKQGGWHLGSFRHFCALADDRCCDHAFRLDVVPVCLPGSRKHVSMLGIS